MRISIADSTATNLLRYGLVLVLLMQLGACAQSQLPARNDGSVQYRGENLAAPLAKIRQKNQSNESFLEYRGGLPYNGEPPGYYGSSGNAFVGGP